MWLYVPSLSVPASGCSTKDSPPASLTSDSSIERSATLSGKPLRPASLPGLWKRDSSIRRLCGLTLPRSMLERGAAAHIASLPGFRASRGARRASSSASAIRGGCGRASPARSRRAPSTWSISRTCGASSRRAGSRRSSMTWPISGSMRNGMCSARPTSGLRISVSASSYWPTASAQEAGSIEATTRSGAPMSHRHTAFDAKGRLVQRTLNRIAERWPTPRTTDETGAWWKDDLNKTLTGKLRRWQTPAVDSFRSRGGARIHELGLDKQARAWPTPAARDEKGANGPAHVGHMDQLPNYVTYSRQARKICAGRRSSTLRRGCRRRLNPAFTAWLMGWPWWWTNRGVTSSARLATGLWRCRLQRRLSCLLDEPSI